MPILTNEYLGKIISVKSRGIKSKEEWKWRKKYKDIWGNIYVFESQEKVSIKKFILVKYYENYLRTGLGELKQKGKIIKLTTKNSVYKFRIIKNNVDKD